MRIKSRFQRTAAIGLVGILLGGAGGKVDGNGTDEVVAIVEELDDGRSEGLWDLEGDSRGWDKDVGMTERENGERLRKWVIYHARSHAKCSSSRVSGFLSWW